MNSKDFETSSDGYFQAFVGKSENMLRDFPQAYGEHFSTQSPHREHFEGICEQILNHSFGEPEDIAGFDKGKYAFCHSVVRIDDKEYFNVVSKVLRFGQGDTFAHCLFIRRDQMVWECRVNPFNIFSRLKDDFDGKSVISMPDRTVESFMPEPEWQEDDPDILSAGNRVRQFFDGHRAATSLDEFNKLSLEAYRRSTQNFVEYLRETCIGSTDYKPLVLMLPDDAFKPLPRFKGVYPANGITASIYLQLKPAERASLGFAIWSIPSILESRSSCIKYHLNVSPLLSEAYRERISREVEILDFKDFLGHDIEHPSSSESLRKIMIEEDKRCNSREMLEAAIPRQPTVPADQFVLQGEKFEQQGEVVLGLCEEWRNLCEENKHTFLRDLEKKGYSRELIIAFLFSVALKRTEIKNHSKDIENIIKSGSANRTSDGTIDFRAISIYIDDKYDYDNKSAVVETWLLWILYSSVTSDNPTARAVFFRFFRSRLEGWALLESLFHRTTLSDRYADTVIFADDSSIEEVDDILCQLRDYFHSSLPDYQTDYLKGLRVIISHRLLAKSKKTDRLYESCSERFREELLPQSESFDWLHNSSALLRALLENNKEVFGRAVVLGCIQRLNKHIKELTPVDDKLYLEDFRLGSSLYRWVRLVETCRLNKILDEKDYSMYLRAVMKRLGSSCLIHDADSNEWLLSVYMFMRVPQDHKQSVNIELTLERARRYKNLIASSFARSGYNEWQKKSQTSSAFAKAISK